MGKVPLQVHAPSMPEIVVQLPFARDRNLGRACNEAMERVPDGGWGVLMDHDIHLTTPHWYAQIEEAIACRPDAGAFCVVTNRCASPWQQAPEGVAAGDSLEAHYRVGTERLKRRTLLDVTVSKGYGAVLHAVNKEAWRETAGFADGMFCVDHSYFFRAKANGRRFYMIDGLYVIHRRASSTGLRVIPPELKWQECPCRGPETMPTERIALP